MPQADQDYLAFIRSIESVQIFSELNCESARSAALLLLSASRKTSPVLGLLPPELAVMIARKVYQSRGEIENWQPDGDVLTGDIVVQFVSSLSLTGVQAGIKASLPSAVSTLKQLPLQLTMRKRMKQAIFASKESWKGAIGIDLRDYHPTVPVGPQLNRFLCRAETGLDSFRVLEHFSDWETEGGCGWIHIQIDLKKVNL